MGSSFFLLIFHLIFHYNLINRNRKYQHCHFNIKPEAWRSMKAYSTVVERAALASVYLPESLVEAEGRLRTHQAGHKHSVAAVPLRWGSAELNKARHTCTRCKESITTGLGKPGQAAPRCWSASPTVHISTSLWRRS